MKNKLFIFMLIFIMVVLWACETNTKEKDILSEEVIIPDLMPDDFYFIMEGGFNTAEIKTLIDTKNNVLGKDEQFKDYLETGYFISDTGLKSIYDNIFKLKLYNLSSSTRYKNPDIGREPDYYYNIFFNINEHEYTIIYHETAIYMFDNLEKFHNFIIDFYLNTDEYKNFPEQPYPWDD